MLRSPWSVIALCALAALPHAHAQLPDSLPVQARAESLPQTTSPQAHAPLKMELPAQPLADAMQAIARLAGLNILADPALVAPYRAPAMSGQFSADAALRRVLEGSGLQVQYVDGRTLILVPDTRVLQPD